MARSLIPTHSSRRAVGDAVTWPSTDRDMGGSDGDEVARSSGRMVRCPDPDGPSMLRVLETWQVPDGPCSGGRVLKVVVR